MEEYFVNLINEAIMNDKNTPKEYDITSTLYGWEIQNRETRETVRIEIYME